MFTKKLLALHAGMDESESEADKEATRRLTQDQEGETNESNTKSRSPRHMHLGGTASEPYAPGPTGRTNIILYFFVGECTPLGAT